MIKAYDRLWFKTETCRLDTDGPVVAQTNHEKRFKIKTGSLDADGTAAKETGDNRRFEIKTC